MGLTTHQWDESQPAVGTDDVAVEGDANAGVVPSAVHPSRRRRLPAWLFSLCFHTVILVTLALVVTNVRRPGGESETRSGGIVLVDLAESVTEYVSGDESTESSESTAEAQPPSFPVAAKAPELPGSEPNDEEVMQEAGKELLQNLPSAESLTKPTTGKPGDLSGQVSTSVFGVEGTGSRFVYLFDRSASMDDFDARPLRAAKRELIQSLQSIGEVQQFQIIFYNDKTLYFRRSGVSETMHYGTESIRNQAVQFVRSITSDGGTDHLTALKAALQLGPDVVFLLTDAAGGFTSDEINRVDDWNRAGSVINAIEFGDGKKSPNGDRSLETLARRNRGQYLYKDIRTLGE
ncbi:MAG: hypothetical protein R3C03_22365 [Pirellulaceae bacterium]